MDLKQISSLVSTFFPQLKINDAINEAQNKVSGVEDSFEAVKNKIQEFGISGNQLKIIADKILSMPSSKNICRILGTNPIAVANDLKKLADGNTNKTLNAPKMVMPKQQNQIRRFPKI